MFFKQRLIFILLFLNLHVSLCQISGLPNEIILDVPDTGDKEYLVGKEINILPGYSFDAKDGSLHAFIKKATQYGSLFTDEDFNNHELDANFEVGTLPASHQVTETGGFSYNVPIELPSGINGMTPQLSVSYSSQSGNGILGMGWNLSGLSMISRTVKPTYFDDEDKQFNFRGTTAVNTNYNDAFALDGQILIGVEGDYGYPGATYGTEVENYTRIISHGSQGKGPEWFEVITKDGMKIKYGSLSQSKVNNHNGTALIWLIDYVEDENGNYIKYEYEEKEGELLLSKIIYTGNSKSFISPDFSVNFEYELREDDFSYFIDHKEITNKHLISAIKIKKGSNEVYSYTFNYGYRLYSFLNSISKQVQGNQVYNPLVFKYGEETDEVFSSLNLSNQDFIGEDYDIYDRYHHQYRSGDFSGNGLSDIYSFSISRGRMNLNDPSATFSILSIYLNEGNNEFKDPYIMGFERNVILSGIQHTRGGAIYEKHILQNSLSGLNVIDFDGDGKDDMFYFKFQEQFLFDELEDQYIPLSNKLTRIGYLHSEINDGEFSLKNIESDILSENGIFYTHIYNENQFNFTGDFTGNGLTDVLFVGANGGENSVPTPKFGITVAPGSPNRKNSVSISDGNSFIYEGEVAEFIAKADFVYVIDFNGDGRADIMATKNDKTRIFSFDLNDDTDYSNPSDIMIDLELKIVEIYDAGFPTKWHDVRLGDFNGDGKTDILTLNPELDKFRIHYSSGRWFLEKEFELSTGIMDIWRSREELFVYDSNGDGKSDIIHIAYGLNPDLSRFQARKQMFKSNGNDFEVTEWDYNFYDQSINVDMRIENHNSLNGKINYNSEDYSVGYRRAIHRSLNNIPNTEHVRKNIQYAMVTGVGDFSGDGSLDLLILPKIFVSKSNDISSEGFGVSLLSQVLPSLFEHSPFSNTNSLISLKDGFNIIKEIEYERNIFSNNFIESDDLQAYPLREFTNRIPLVGGLTIKDQSQNIISEFEYTFKKPILHQRGKGLLAFTEVENYDVINEMKATNYYSIFVENIQPTLFYDWDDNHFSPYLKASEIYSKKTEELISKSEYEYLFEDLTNKRRLQFLSKETSEAFIEETKQQTQYINDIENGNLKEKITLINDGEYHEKEIYIYAEITSPLGFENKLISLKSEQQKFGEELFISEANFEYYPVTGLLKEKTIHANTPFEVTEEYEYDVFGNAVKSTTKVLGEQDRVSETVYDVSGRLPQKTVNELGQEATFEYHPIFDKPIKITDADGLTSTSSYDEFGRLVETKDKSGIVSTVQKEWITTNPNVTAGNPTDADDIMYKVTESRQGEPDKTTYYNRLGQVRMKEIQGYNNISIYSVTTYNNKGQVVASTEPFFQGATNISLSQTTYDGYNRVASVTSNGETVTYTYTVENGLQKTTTTNPDGTTHIAYEDAAGNLIKSQDNGGLIEYSYFSHGGVKEIKLNSKTVATSEYDAIGRQTKLIDINAGTSMYTYTPFGEMKSSTSANGANRIMEYDEYGRLVQEHVDGYTTNYEYIDEGNGLNQLKKISTADGMEEIYDYDELGRVNSVTESILGETFTFSYTYNELNQTESITYPSGLIVYNTYDDKGTLIKVTNAQGQIYWEGREQDALGRFTSFIKGDGVTTTYKFDEFQQLEEIQAGNIQHHAYQWDNQTGNLSERKDLVYGLRESFTYDNLNRLETGVASSLSGGIVLNSISTAYEENGNITYKNDAGTYAYHEEKINAVTATTNDMGQISSLTQDITYTSRQKAEFISEGDHNLSFVYGHDNQRRKTIYSNQNGVQLEKYFVGLYEKEVEGNTIRHINYVSAGDGMTAIVIMEEENNVITEETYFTYKDHLGSIVALTDINGDVILEQSFDAWGRYRSPIDWTYNNVEETPTWLRGYTGHEHLPHFDLINMNGRVYDPILGRMLSPDTYVQDPLSSQSYNRYSYCWNNPLRYTDPSGELIWMIPMAVGFATGYISHGATTGDWGWSAVVSGAIGAAVATIGFYSGGATSAASIAGSFKSAGLGGHAATVALGYSGRYVASAAISSVMPSLNVPLGGNVSVSVSPAVIFSSTQSGLGVNVSGTFQYEGFNATLGARFMSYGSSHGGVEGLEYWALGYDNGTTGISYSSSYYTSGETSQQLGAISLRHKDVSFTYQNDFMFGLPADGGDRYRTAAAQVSWRNYSAGFNLFTGDPGLNGSNRETEMINGKATYKMNRYGDNPNKYRTGVGYVGYGNMRIGRNSEKIRNLIQNKFAHDVMMGGNSPYFKVLNLRPTNYFSVGTYHPYTLW